MADSFYSFLDANELIITNISKDFISFKKKGNNLTLYYSISLKKIFIHEDDYKDQPHILIKQIYNNNNYHALCLTMDNNHSEISLNAPDMLKRAYEIVNEEWPDKIRERFHELIILWDIKKSNNYLLYNEQLYSQYFPSANFRKTNVPILTLNFSGQNKKKGYWILFKKI